MHPDLLLFLPFLSPWASFCAGSSLWFSLFTLLSRRQIGLSSVTINVKTSVFNTSVTFKEWLGEPVILHGVK
jgi:hypothetical protein